MLIPRVNPMKKILLLSMCLATAFLFLSVSAHAATNTFTGNGDWYNNNNWAGNARPTSTDDASILPGLGNGAAAIAYVDHGSVTVNSMTINPTNGSAASAGYVVGNGTLNVTGALTVGGTGTTTTFLQYNGNGALNAGSIVFNGSGTNQQQNLTFGGAGGGSLTVGGGTGTITHTGTSTLNIVGRSATPVTINANINAPSKTYLNAGDQTTGAITLNSGNSWNVFVTQVSFNANNSTNRGTLNINGGSLTTQAVYLNNGNQGGNSVVNLNEGGTIKTFDIRRFQAGASQTFNWNDGTIVNWQANAAQILQSNLGSGTPLVLSLAGTGTHTFEVTGAAGTTTVSSSAMLVDKAGENGTLNKTGLGTLILNGANTHSGATTLRAGTLALGHTNALQNSTLDTGSSGAQAVSFTAAGTNTYNLGGLGGGDDLALGANRLSVGVNNASTSFAGGISGTGGLTKAGSGTLTLSGANTFTGGMRFNGGTLELGNPSALAAGNYLKYESQASGTALVKVAYAVAGPDLGNLEVDVNGTLDLGTNSSAEIRFATATGWMAGATLTITNSTGGGKLYILDSEGLDSAQIVSAENPTYVASVDDNGLVTFTAPTPVGSTFTSWLGATPATSDLLLQYAFGAVSATQPVAPAYFPQASVTETGGVRSLVLTYYVRQGTQGLEVEPELSTDLGAANNGFAESVSITKSDHEISELGGVSLQRKTASVPIESGAAKKFLRARVTQN